MKKVLMLLILLGGAASSYANNEMASQCAFLSVHAGMADKQLKAGKNINSLDLGNGIKEVYKDNASFFDAMVRDFALKTSYDLPSDYVSSFFAHACNNKYIFNNDAIKVLTPMIKNDCVGSGMSPNSCIVKTVNKFAASLN